MTLQAAQLQVGTAAVRVDEGLARIRAVTIRNRGGGPVYLGPSDVTPDVGFQLDPGESATVELNVDLSPVYAVAAVAGQLVHVIGTSAK